MWFFKERRGRLCSVSITCNTRLFPEICSQGTFLQVLADEFLDNLQQNIEDVKTIIIAKNLLSMKMSPTHLRNVWCVVRSMRNRSELQVLESDQQIEDYLLKLNRNGQFGIILYSNGELVVPNDTGRSQERRSCGTGQSSRFLLRFGGSHQYYWQVLPRVEASSAKKRVYMTFEAVSAAVRAFQFSFPVICLDACTIKCPYTRAVLLSATFQTTDGHLLTMCFGTAPTESMESWSFFLVNLRQALLQYCPDIKDLSQLVFMSDRHRGLLAGIPLHFPSAKHLFCVVHLLRNLNPGGKMPVTPFWQAVEATTEEQFNSACDKLPQSRTLEVLRLVENRKHWSRYAIRSDGTKRYCVRTNNWAESQNNALMKVRCGPILEVLLNSFIYSTDKIKSYAKDAERYMAEPGRITTAYGQAIFERNSESAEHCRVQCDSEADNVWSVYEGRTSTVPFIVKKTSQGAWSCSCHRYFDEGVPCPHMLSVMFLRGHSVAATSLISPIYTRERFSQAFPVQILFYPASREDYLKNPNVVPQDVEKHPGQNQMLRFPSRGERLSGNCGSHHVSRVPPRPRRDSDSDGHDEHGEDQGLLTLEASEFDEEMSAMERKILDLDRSLAEIRNVTGSLLKSVRRFINEKQDDESDTESETESESSCNPVNHDAESSDIEVPDSLSSGSSTEDDNSSQTGAFADGFNLLSQGSAPFESLPEYQVPTDDLLSGDDDDDDFRLPAASANNGEIGLSQDHHACLSSMSMSTPPASSQLVQGATSPAGTTKARKVSRSKRGTRTKRRGARGSTYLVMARMAPSPDEHTGIEGTDNGNVDSGDKRTGNNGQERNETSSKRLKRRAQSKRKDNLRALIRERYASVLKHDADTYVRWQEYYACQYFGMSVNIPGFTSANKTSPKVKPAVISLAFIVPDRYLTTPELKHMQLGNDLREHEPTPVLSLDVILQFLAHVHAFTFVGLEAQAIAYSYGESGTIKYLALFPQKNKEYTVNDITVNEHGNPLSYHVAVNNAFSDLDSRDVLEDLDDLHDYVPRFWIFTHVKSKAFMSPSDIIRLYNLNLKNPNMFAIVISPKLEGVKALCVRLIDQAKDVIGSFFDEAQRSKQSDPVKYVEERLDASPLEYYRQISVVLSDDDVECKLIDLREEKEVVGQIEHYILSGKPDFDWIP